MILKKAIEIGELNIKEVGRKMPPDTLDALKLLTEAGKHIEAYRHPPFQGSKELLPGETLDDDS